MALFLVCFFCYYLCPSSAFPPATWIEYWPRSGSSSALDLAPGSEPKPELICHLPWARWHVARRVLGRLCGGWGGSTVKTCLCGFRKAWGILHCLPPPPQPSWGQTCSSCLCLEGLCRGQAAGRQPVGGGHVAGGTVTGEARGGGLALCSLPLLSEP